METIEEKAVKLYNKNILFLQKNFRAVYDKINLFEQAIENGLYKEIFALEYKDDSYFDLYLEETDTFLYGENSDEYSDKITQTVKFDRNNAFVNTRKTNLIITKFKLDDNVGESSHSYFTPIRNYINKNRKKKEAKFNKIEKFIFIGTGLGLHIPKIAQKIKSKVYLIIEPNIEIFRLSLFVTDYTNLVEDVDNIYFSIADDDNEFIGKFNSFYYNYKQLNHIFKFNIFMDSYNDYFGKIANTLLQLDPLAFPYSIKFASADRLLMNLKNNYKFLDYSKPLLKGYKVCLVAPGPSLNKTIQWLEENHNKVIIVSLGAAVRRLARSNIVADIITSVDPYTVVLTQFENLDEKFYKNSIFLCASNTHPEVLDLFNKDKIFMYPVIVNIGVENLQTISGITVSEVSYALLLLLGVKELYLFGIDAAFDQESGSTHVKEHGSYSKKILQKTDLLQKLSITQDNIIEVEGNKTDTVFTTMHWSAIIGHFREHTKRLNKNTTVYNTSFGAKFEGIPAIDIEEININDKIDKEALNIEIKSIFNDNYLTGLDDEVIEKLTKDLETTKKILKILKT